MSTRCWIGGTGNWSDLSHWSYAVDGPGGYSLPTFDDDVKILSQLTADSTITLDVDASCHSFVAQSLEDWNFFQNYTESDFTLTGYFLYSNEIGTYAILAQSVSGVVGEISSIGTYYEGYPPLDLLDENCDDISDWDNGDVGDGVSEVNPAGQFQFDSGPSTGSDAAIRSRVIDTPPEIFEIEIRTYFDAIGTHADFDNATLIYASNSWKFCAKFCSDGLFIYKSVGSVEVGTNIVQIGVWQTWKFSIDRSAGVGSETVIVELDGIYQDTVVCDYNTGPTDGLIQYSQEGYTTANRISRFDYIKVVSHSTDLTLTGYFTFEDSTGSYKVPVGKLGDTHGDGFYLGNYVEGDIELTGTFDLEGYSSGAYLIATERVDSIPVIRYPVLLFDCNSNNITCWDTDLLDSKDAIFLIDPLGIASFNMENSQINSSSISFKSGINISANNSLINITLQKSLDGFSSEANYTFHDINFDYSAVASSIGYILHEDDITFNNITTLPIIPSSTKSLYVGSITAPGLVLNCSSWMAKGSVADDFYINLSAPGAPFIPMNINQTSGIVNVENCTILYSNASGGAIFYAFLSEGNVDGGGNTGWLFYTALLSLNFDDSLAVEDSFEKIKTLVLISIGIVNFTQEMLVGDTQQIMAIGYYDDGSSAIITQLVTWVSSNAVVATIDSEGLVVALLEGISFITASLVTPYGTILSRVMLRVSESITINLLNTANLQLIPLSSAPNQTFNCVLTVDGKSKNLSFRFRWNGQAEYWAMTIIDPTTGNYLVDGIPLTAGVQPTINLLQPYGYMEIGSCYIVNVSGNASDYPDDTNLGTDYLMFWGDTEL